MTTTAPAARLLASTARRSYDPDVDIDWDAPLVDGMYYMQPERISLYGTPMWQQLSDQQRVELSKHEICSIASVGVWFELILMQLLTRRLFDEDSTTAEMQYALTEIGDECRHSVMFGKMVDAFGAPAYGASRLAHELGRGFKTLGGGASAFASILVAEEVLDRLQRETMRDERVQPLSRMVSRIHVLEEARHVTYARDMVQRLVPRLSRRRLAMHRALTAQVAFHIARSLVHPGAYRAVGLDPRVARRAAMANPHYRASLQWQAEKIVGFLREQDLVGGASEQVWRRALLVP
ncbi:MAG: AurF N-oxygenase family protein [Nocardioidaceae bacterium]